ncbi:MAG: CocE/NonD family hydrolase, partial [Acidobacteria bacterium]|nr:CocE/NonD family hydrolase [Acidobacteriota bacterium]
MPGLTNVRRHRAVWLAALALGIELFSRGAVAPRANFIARPAAQAEVRYEIVVSKNVMVTMRDGVRLATDVYRPALNGQPAPGKFPAILERTPYNKDGIAGWARYFVPRGYVAVGQDVRGRFASEGRWRPHRDDVNDGYDTAKWIGAQAWSDGSFGTVGTSYPGGTQHALAISNPPYLKTMIPVDAMSNYGRFGIRHNGAFELRWMNWIFNIGAPNGSQEAHEPAVRQAVLELGVNVRVCAKGMPLRRGTTPLRLVPDYEAWLIEAMSHGDYADFWKNMGASVVDHLSVY